MCIGKDSTSLPITNPLDTHDALRYIWLTWRLTGIHPVDTHYRIYWTYSLLLFCALVLFTGLYLVTFAIQKNFTEVLESFSLLIPLIYTFSKQAIICYHIRGDLPKAASHLHALDRRAEQYPDDCACLKRKVRQCHNISIASLTGTTICLLLYALVGIIQHELPYQGWMPFDWQHSMAFYALACAFQIFCLCITTTSTVCNDIYSVVYLLLLVAHLRILNDRIVRLGSAREFKYTNESHKEMENHQQLADCVRDHKECMRFYNCIRPAIAATIFVQFVSTALALCTSAAAFVSEDFSLFQLMKFFLYSVVVLFEIAPCCWFMDEALAQMHKLTNSLFSCRWYEQDHKFRRSLIIFMQRSQVADKILAGNIAPVSLDTLVQIIKFAFSLFTLLKQLK